MDSLEGYVSDDQLAIGPLADLGWAVDTVSWRNKTVDWSEYDIVVIRTTWDYQGSAHEFLTTLAQISDSSHLENPIDIVKWNLSKEYLREIGARGVPIVPTLWNESYHAASFSRWLELLDTDELIVKPLVSATAERTYRLRDFEGGLASEFAGRGFMVQPFLPTVTTEGEFSLFYFNGEFSHAIVKRPQTGDFRVQEEHGGIITAITADEDLLAGGRKVFKFIETAPLYARVDLIRGSAGEFLLMELELIEPALYFRMDNKAPNRFAKALDDKMRRLS
jgi:glutathione synthase/RimK-type ligase-like ATP-grasp enzyme